MILIIGYLKNTQERELSAIYDYRLAQVAYSARARSILSLLFN